MIASLPMYDWPEVSGATASLWTAFRDGLRGVGFDAPDDLTGWPDDVFAHWRAPRLVLSQTCGLPFAAQLAGDVSLVGTPVYDLPDLTRGYYCSRIVVRADDPAMTVADLAGRRFAFNMRESQSGWAAFATSVADPRTHFGEIIESGAHRASVVAVAEGKADAAAIDAVTWALALRHEPAAKSLRVLASTPQTPGLPYITAKRPEAELALMRLALQTAIDHAGQATRDALLISDIVRIRAEEYAPLAAGWPA